MKGRGGRIKRVSYSASICQPVSKGALRVKSALNSTLRLEISKAHFCAVV